MEVEDFLSIFDSRKGDEDEKRQDREMYWGSKKIVIFQRNGNEDKRIDAFYLKKIGRLSEIWTNNWIGGKEEVKELLNEDARGAQGWTWWKQSWK